MFVGRIGRVYRSNRVLSQNILSTAGLKGGSIVISIATMPAYLDFFRDTRVLGAWFTILSLLTFITAFDFGVGNGLRNSIATAVSEPDTKNARDLISAAYLIALAIAAVAGLVGYIAVTEIDWLSIFNLQNQQIPHEAVESALLIILATICVQLVLRNAISILYGLQKMVIANLGAFFTSVAILVFLLTARVDNLEQNLLNLAWAYSVATLGPLVILHLILFVKILPGCTPSITSSANAFRRVGKLGLAFFAIQVALLVISSTDQILMVLLFEGEDVVDYQIYLRVFTLFTILFQLLTQPFWSAITAAHVAKNREWVVKATRSLYTLAGVGTCISLLIVPFLQLILDIWLGSGAIVVGGWYALAFALLVSLQMFLYAGTTIANGTGQLRPQQFWMPIGALLKFPLAFLMASALGAWPAIVLAHALALVPLVIAQTFSLHKEGLFTRTLINGRYG